MTSRRGPDDVFSTAVGATFGELSEGKLVEQSAIDLFQELGWQAANLYFEKFGVSGTEGRESKREVFLQRRLRKALETLNPGLPPTAIDQATAILMEDRSTMLPVNANCAVYDLVKDGIKVTVPDAHGEPQPELVRVIDWREAANNDFFLASQMWVSADLYDRRPDLIGFVNGIPLVFIELKGAHKSVADAYDDNLRDYKDTIPQVFHPNGFTILSNGAEAVMGASHGELDHFSAWSQVADESETPGQASLATMILSTCSKERLLDIVESFIVFEEGRGGLTKKIARNHQYVGVNRAIASVTSIKENRGRLGVFWHTQGSGKSLSMVYFAQKVHRTLPGNWTFVIVTDRQELDDQIAKTFANVGALGKGIENVQAGSREHLKELLSGNERYVFTLIQKFSVERGETYPKLSDRSDIIVMTDEAHRSQYDLLAANMRRALPKAAFIGFTGTPLMAGEERTREVFGDYVSIYNFSRSIEDGATVPLYYENRIPELQLTNEDLADELEELVDNAGLDEDQQKRLERDFARQYQLITRSDRLDKIAADLVRHFAGRGYRGKAMLIAIDKATAVRMYHKVQKHWASYLKEQEGRLAAAKAEEREALEQNLVWLKTTDMAVVVSQSQNEIDDMRRFRIDMRPHRERMVKEDLAEKFKDPANPLRLVFVCAMWITGFDVPTCSTVYLDKPMKNHTLMQTIARANRRAPGKEAGLIVDHVGVFGNLQKALAIYAKPGQAGASPIKSKTALVEELRGKVEEAKAFCGGFGVDAMTIWTVQKFERIARIKQLTDDLIAPEERRKGYLQRADKIVRLFKAVLPDNEAADFVREVAAYQIIADRIRSLIGQADIGAITASIDQLLDQSIAGVEITAPLRQPGEESDLIDLSSIDFEKLTGALNKKTKVEQMRVVVTKKIERMISANPTRQGLMDRLTALLDVYNAGSATAEELLKQLMNFVKELNEEERRGVRQGLTEEELAIFDLLTRPEPKLTKAQRIEVQKVAKSLLGVLRKEKLVFEWRKRQQTRAMVKTAIEEELDQLPSDPYPKSLWDQKVTAVYQHVFERM
jgi:type I restriction enzyme, R subunit